MIDVPANKRTRNYIEQIGWAAVFRAFAMAASFVSIPILINYLGEEKFGIWATLLTIVSWMIFFDLGIGNGLRNKMAESLAQDKIEEARNLISSGYAMIGLVSLFILVFFGAISFFLPWVSIFNAATVSESDLKSTVLITFVFICINFWASLIASLLGAIQKTSLIMLGQAVSNILALVLVLFLTRVSESSLSSLAFVYGVSLISGNIALSYWFFKRHPGLRPRPQLQKRYANVLINVGLRFFVIQVAVLIIFTTDKLLITQLFGPRYVTQYEVVYKLYSVILIVHGLITAPLWSAYTEAYHRGDIEWIKGMLSAQMKVYFGLLTIIGILVPFSSVIIELWVGSGFAVEPAIVYSMALFTAVSAWNNLFAILINGIGNIGLQLITSVVAMIINIPLSILYARHLEMGVSGVLLGTITSLLIAAVVLPAQVKYILGRELKSTVA